MDKFDLIFLLLLLFTVLSSFYVGYLFSSWGITFETFLASNEIESNCTNLSFLDTVDCLNKDFSSWYVFNISNQGKKLTEEELKTEGGVCAQASEWYVNKIKKLGFQGITVAFFDVNKEIGHQIAIVYTNDLEEYCVLDQKSVLGCNILNIRGVEND